tara:strand:- start:219 stop:797 length:579 start_codon:yes stop_codon:yes gene_type:complete
MSMNLGTIWSNKKIQNNRIFKNTHIKRNNVIKVPRTQIRNVNGIASKSYWGGAVWMLFHTISVRINGDYYSNNHQYVWDFIKKICKTLPCPYCQKHANAYIGKIAIHQINTKDKLKTVLFNFHNSVNIRIGKKAENISILTKYNNANIKAIFDLFEQRFFHSYVGTRNFNDWIKNGVKKEYYAFFNTVRTKF